LTNTTDTITIFYNTLIANSDYVRML